MRNVGLPTRETRIVAPKALLAVSGLRLPDSATGGRLRLQTCLRDFIPQTPFIKQAQAAAGHTTAAMTLKHYVKGRQEHTNTAAPIANAYGLGN